MLKFQRKLWSIAFHGGAMAYYLSLLFSFLTNASVVFVERMITTWYMTIHINFIILTFLQDLIHMRLGSSSKTYRIISSVTNLLFISTVFPFALYIPLTYWVLFYYNKNLIHPTFLEVSLPPWVSTGSHSVITLVALAELVLNKHIYEGNYLLAISILVTFSSCYVACLILTYKQFGFWIYPVFHLFSDKMLPFVFILLGIVLLGIFFTGSIINQIFHGKSRATHVTNHTSSIPQHKARYADQFDTSCKPDPEPSYSPSESPVFTPHSYLSADRSIKDSKLCRLCENLKQQEERFRGAIDSSKNQVIRSISKNNQFCCIPDDDHAVQQLSSNTLELTDDHVVIHDAPFRCNSTTKIAFETVVQDDKNRLKRQNAKSKCTDMEDSISYEEGAQRTNYKGKPSSNEVEPCRVNQRVDNKPLKNNKELRDFVNCNLMAKNCKMIDIKDCRIAEEDIIPLSSSTEDSIAHSDVLMGNDEGQQLLDSLEDPINSVHLSIQNGIINPNLCLTRALTSYMHHIQNGPAYDQQPETSTQHEPVWNVHRNQQSSYLHVAQHVPICNNHTQQEPNPMHDAQNGSSYFKQVHASNVHHIQQDPRASHCIQQTPISKFHYDKPKQSSNIQPDQNLHWRRQSLSNLHHAQQALLHHTQQDLSNSYHTRPVSTSNLYHTQDPSNAHQSQQVHTSNVHQSVQDLKQHTQLGLSGFHHTRHAPTCNLYHTRHLSHETQDAMHHMQVGVDNAAMMKNLHHTQQEPTSSLPDPPQEHTINALHTNMHHARCESTQNRYHAHQNIPSAIHEQLQNPRDELHEQFSRRSDLLHVLTAEENSPLSLDDMILAQNRSRTADNVYFVKPYQTGSQNSLRLLPIEENSPLSLDDMKLISNQFRAVVNINSADFHHECGDDKKLNLDEIPSIMISRQNEGNAIKRNTHIQVKASLTPSMKIRYE